MGQLSPSIALHRTFSAVVLLLSTIGPAAFATTTVPDSSGSPWTPDLGNGSYKNPVLHADYSDPDAIRVGNDYWLVSSSFNHVPGLPILHSKDLVNWELVSHALPRLAPADVFAIPQHGKGVWAPALRYHAGKYWIYFPDPDFGLYVITADAARGPWNSPVLVKRGLGLIDPCPLWDDDGTLYLIHAWAKSRSGISNVLTLLRLDPSGTRVENDYGILIDGGKLPAYRTLEGPKLYKRHGWYYIFAPAGGVATGWQSVFRAKNIHGPYENRIVLAQGNTPVNGPHQGALVDTPSGESWFLHFQDKGAYGRVVHLEPVTWTNDWPVIGRDSDGDGTGEPVLVHAKPNLPSSPVAAPATSDEFDSAELGRQWQWQANPRPHWFSTTDSAGHLRLFAQPAPKLGNVYDAPFLLLQKFPAPEFTVTAKLEFSPKTDGDSAGVIVFGTDYAWLGLERIHGSNSLVLATCHSAPDGRPQTETILERGIGGAITLAITVREGALCRFAWSTTGKTFTPVSAPDFKASPGRWVGAKIGIFSAGAPGGFADWDWFHVGSAGP